jgi:hypothetical protein
MKRIVPRFYVEIWRVQIEKYRFAPCGIEKYRFAPPKWRKTDGRKTLPKSFEKLKAPTLSNFFHNSQLTTQTMMTMKTATLLRQQQRRTFSVPRSCASWWCCCTIASAYLSYLPSTTTAWTLHTLGPTRRSIHTGSRCFLSASSSSSSSSSSTTSITQLPPLVTTGGDFAGFSGTFVATTGQLQPIPEYLVPKELLEWGQEPSALEIIVSEESHDDSDTDIAALDCPTWSRQTVTVLPAVGCAVDNMSTQKQEQTWQTVHRTEAAQVAVQVVNSGGGAVKPAATAATASTTWAMEASFGWNPQQEDSESVDSSSHRVSMQVTATVQDVPHDFDANVVLKSPVLVRLERQTNVTSSRGTIADGGGLDGRRVLGLLGESMRRHSGFAAKKNCNLWKADHVNTSAENDKSSSIRLSERVHFPGNLTLAVGTSSDDSDSDSSSSTTTVLEVGHILSVNGQSVRHVVQCTLPSTNTKATATLPVVQSWIEEGTIL